MKKSIFSIILILLVTGSGFYLKASGSENSGGGVRSGTEQIIHEYTDAEFRQALINILKYSNTTNANEFLLELEKVRKGNEGLSEPEESSKGMSNIGSEYNGYSGWDVAAGGIVIVFLGLILISLVVLVFNIVLKEKAPKPHTEKAAPEVATTVKDGIPEADLAAIAVSVELYYRLYLDRSPSGITFSNKESSAWRNGNRFGVRKTQRKQQ